MVCQEHTSGHKLRPQTGSHFRRPGRNHRNVGGRDRARARQAERERARANRPDDLRAWILYQRGLWHTYKRTQEDLAEAQRLFRQAIEIDPRYGTCLCRGRGSVFFQFVGGFVDTGPAAKTDALKFAEKAVELDGQDAFNRYALGLALTLVRRHDSPCLNFAKQSSSIQASLRPITPSVWRLPPVAPEASAAH